VIATLDSTFQLNHEVSSMSSDLQTHAQKDKDG